MLSSTQNIKILYVEDDNVARENGIEYLENYFDTIYDASDGLEALNLYDKHKPDIIITDIEMPKLTGLEFVKKIREKDNTTQVIITTAYSHKEYLFRAIELKLIKYLVKPINEKDFDEAINLCITTINDENNLSNIIKISNDTIFDTYNKTLVKNGELVKLRTKELDLLCLLIKNKTRFVTYVEIENKIWIDSVMTKDALKTVIKNLKSKLPQNTISNLSGTGYKIEL
ncbi:response regulator [Arcobacteraceae bacterium]|nr:response regulator [Arcobacteraceae bacterium]